MLRPTLLLLLCFSICYFSCTKENDLRERFKGNYHLTGTAKFVFDAYNQNWEDQGNDTASFYVSYAAGNDSTDYIVLNGGVISSSPYQYNIIFKEKGDPVYAKVEGNTFTIPIQFPWSGSGLSIQGNGIVENNEVQLMYTTYYRGFTKTATLSGKRL